MALPPALQNKNVQIGIIAVAILVALGFLFKMVLGSNQPPPDAMMTGAGPGYSPGSYPGGPPGAYPGPPGGPGGTGGYPGGPSVSGYGTDAAGGGASLTGAGGTDTPTKKAGPRPPTRKDPFKTPPELMPPPVDIAAQLPGSNDLYVDMVREKINAPTVEQFVREVPDPPMRMAGALFGNRVYGVLEINGQTQVVNPGDRVGIYRVERIEREKIVLSRPGKEGRRRVEAQLTGNPALAGQYPTADPNAGGVPGYGGPPGYSAGGGTTGGRTGN